MAFAQGVCAGAGLPGKALIRTDRNNFAPRFSLAWRPSSNNTVFRAGIPNINDPATNISNLAAVGVITSVPNYFSGQMPRRAWLN